MVRVIATDLDGTLLKPKKKFALVEKENRNFIKEFYGDIVIVSGRGPKFCAKICDKLKIEHHFITFNGALIVKNGNVIYRQSLKKTILNNLADYLQENYTKYELLIFDKYDQITCFSPTRKCLVKRKYFKKGLKNGRLNEKVKISNKKVKKLLTNSTDLYKAIIYTKGNNDDMTSMLKEKFGEHFEFFTNSHSIEIAPRGVNKGEALKYLISTTSVKEDEVFVIGDGINDLSMFELFKNSFAISQADNKLKLNAKHIINKFSDLDEYTRLNNNFH